MIGTRTLASAVLSAVAFSGFSAEAQTTGRTSTQTRQTSPSFGASAGRAPTGSARPSGTGNAAASVGGGIAQGVQSFSAGVPALQEAQQLRDTGLRGQFVGAEAATMHGFGSPQATYGQQGGARPNVRISPLRQPGARAGQASPYGRQAGTVMQPTLSLGFSAPAPSSAAVQRIVSDAVLRVPSIRENGSIAVRVEDGVVVLEGTVGSSHHSALVTQLVALEPGVTRVDNRLTVRPAPTP